MKWKLLSIIILSNNTNLELFSDALVSINWYFKWDNYSENMYMFNKKYCSVWNMKKKEIIISFFVIFKAFAP